MRDTEREKTYNVERLFKQIMDRQHECPTITIAGSTVVLPAEHRFADLASVQRYVDLVCPGITVRAARRHARRAHYEYDTNTIAIPFHRGSNESNPYYHLRAETVLHEIAHKLSPHNGHGKVFRSNLVDLVGKFIGDEAGFILGYMFHQEGL